jgi:hypothetical protein
MKPELISYLAITLLIASFFIYKYRVDERIVRIQADSADGLAFQRSMEIEQRFFGKSFPNLSLTVDGTTINLHDTLLQSINLTIVTTLEDCDLCRDVELERWGLFNRDFNKINASVILIDKKLSDPKKRREFVALAKSLSGLPVFFLDNQEQLEDLNLLPEDTPMMFFLSPDGRVIFSYKGHSSSQARSEHIEYLFKQIMVALEECGH